MLAWQKKPCEDPDTENPSALNGELRSEMENLCAINGRGLNNAAEPESTLLRALERDSKDQFFPMGNQ